MTPAARSPHRSQHRLAGTDRLLLITTSHTTTSPHTELLHEEPPSPPRSWFQSLQPNLSQEEKEKRQRQKKGCWEASIHPQGSFSSLSLFGHSVETLRCFTREPPPPPLLPHLLLAPPRVPQVRDTPGWLSRCSSPAHVTWKGKGDGSDRPSTPFASSLEMEQAMGDSVRGEDLHLPSRWRAFTCQKRNRLGKKWFRKRSNPHFPRNASPHAQKK